MKKVRLKKLTHRGVSHHFLLPVLAILAVGGIGYYMLTLSDAATVPGDPKGTQARRAYDFRNSQGVIAHIDTDTYKKVGKENVLNSLKYIGVFNVRDNITRENDMRTYLARNGVGLHSTTSTPGEKEQPLSTKKNVTDQSAKNRINDILSNPKSGDKYIKVATAVEPYNEYTKKSKADKNWPTTLLNLQKAMWSEAAKAKKENPNFKVLGPSLIGYNMKDTSKPLDGKGFSNYLDYGNVHSYYGGDMPETNLATNDGFDGFVVSKDKIPTKSNTLEERLKIYSSRISGNKPVVVTETGYHDYMDNAKGLHKPTDKNAVGVYMPRVFLENFRIGVARTYAYQMFNEIENKTTYEKHFGMFDTGGRTTPKPSAKAMHFMNMRLVDDTASAKTFKPAKLDFTLTNKPENVRTVLLQKSNGTFYLMIWRAESVYDGPTERFRQPADPAKVGINFGRKRTVVAYYQNLADDDGRIVPVGTNTKSVDVDVSARVSVIEIK